MQPRTTRGGQAWYSPLAILTVLTLRAVFRLAYRQAEGLIGSIISLPGLTLRVPDHTTLSRRSATLEVPRPTAGDCEARPVHLLVARPLAGRQYGVEVMRRRRVAG
ncbi:MAG TPA: transposase [Stellaceae bacterium]